MVPAKEAPVKLPLSLSSKNPALTAPLFAVNSPMNDSGQGHSNVPHPVGCETSGACERSSTQATGKGFAVGHKSILAIQAGFGVFANRRRRVYDPIAAAGYSPEGPGHRERQEEAFHRTPRSASFSAGVSTEAGVVKKPLVLRTATACVPFCTIRAAK